MKIVELEFTQKPSCGFMWCTECDFLWMANRSVELCNSDMTKYFELGTGRKLWLYLTPTSPGQAYKVYPMDDECNVRVEDELMVNVYMSFAREILKACQHFGTKFVWVSCDVESPDA